MDGFFNPRGIVVFGVSPSFRNLARTTIQNLKLHNYQGRVVGIGSRKSKTLGVKIYTALTEVEDVKDSIDLVVILTPAPTVIPILKECQKVGIKRAIIMSGGFKELTGPEDPLSAELSKVAKEGGIRFIGPNCQGIIDTWSGVCLPFGIMSPGKLKKGDISIISQSGTVCWVTPLILSHEISGVNKVVSLGNKMNVDEVDMLDYLLRDETTRLIILHLESTEWGRDLFSLLSRSSKPVILLKTQVYPESSSAAYSHTAALADDDRIVEGACLQAGIMRATTFREMIEMAKALSLPLIKGKRVAILSSSGGMGIMAADACKRAGMELATVPDKSLEEIGKLGKAKVIKLSHPVDVGNIYNNRDIFRAMKIVMEVEGVHGGVLSLFHIGTGAYFEGYQNDVLVNKIASFSGKIKKPIAIHFICDPLSREEIKARTQFPLFNSIEEAVEALSYLWNFTLLRQKSERWKEPLEMVTGEPFQFKTQISPDLEGFCLLSEYEIPCEPPVPVKEEKEILKTAEDLNYPLALKAISPDFTHKLSHGAVALNLCNAKELKEALQRMVEALKRHRAKVDTFILQRMVPPGPELIFGGKRDPPYGPVLLLGFGGTEVEEREKAVCYLAPISAGMAEDMLAYLGGPCKKGSPYHEPLKGALTRFSRLLVDNPQMEEIDLNPVRLLPEKGLFKVLDVRVKLKKEER